MPVVASEVTELFNAGGMARDSTERATILRIRAILDRARHPSTPQPEADLALTVAAREMRRRNIAEELVFERSDAIRTSEEATRRGAAFCVKLTLTSGQVLAQRVLWVYKLISTCLRGFNVASYTRVCANRGYHHVVFYGLRGNAELAASAFSHYVNRVEAMSAVYTIPYHNYQCMRCNEVLCRHERGAQTLEARNSYRRGMAAGLSASFVAERREEHDRVAELEARAEKSRRKETALAASRAATAFREHELAAHAIHTLATNGDPAAPFIVDVDADDDFDADAAEQEVAVSRALATTAKNVEAAVLSANNISVNSTVRRRPTTYACPEAYQAGRIDGKRMRLEDNVYPVLQ